MSFKQLIIKQSESINYQFTESDFDLSHWCQKSDSVSLEGGRGASRKIIIEGKPYVLRHYLRGGFMARFLYDQYIWTGLARTRPVIENKISRLAINSNLPVAEVVAYRVKKQGLFYRASIISRFINNKGTLADILCAAELADNLWFELGGLIKRLHQLNIFHADLNANNILINEGSGCSIIDFDKAEIISPLGDAAQKNIQRLWRSLKKIQTSRIQKNSPFHFTDENWQQLLAGYR